MKEVISNHISDVHWGKVRSSGLALFLEEVYNIGVRKLKEANNNVDI